VSRRTAIALIGAIPVSLARIAAGDEYPRSRQGLTQPVFRVSKRVERLDPSQAQHPLDPAIEIAKEGLVHIRDNIRDYSCTMVKQERINGVVGEAEYIYAEIRNRKVVNGRIAVPFSVYMRFVAPESVKGREVIYVEGRNNNKLVAHEGSGFKAAFGAVWLPPDGVLAMQGQLYPITEAGIENLVVKLIERAERDRQMGHVDVQFLRNAKINGRPCTVLQVMHPERRPEHDFYTARIFIDDELNVPIRYAAYDWPRAQGGRPEIIECYTYLNMKLNVGLTDDDFDHEKKFTM
jgi:hypothetical protein